MGKTYRVVMTDRLTGRVVGALTCFDREHAAATFEAWRMRPEIRRGERGLKVIEVSP